MCIWSRTKTIPTHGNPKAVLQTRLWLRFGRGQQPSWSPPPSKAHGWRLPTTMPLVVRWFSSSPYPLGSYSVVHFWKRIVSCVFDQNCCWNCYYYCGPSLCMRVVSHDLPIMCVIIILWAAADELITYTQFQGLNLANIITCPENSLYSTTTHTTPTLNNNWPPALETLMHWSCSTTTDMWKNTCHSSTGYPTLCIWHTSSSLNTANLLYNLIKDETLARTTLSSYNHHHSGLIKVSVCVVVIIPVATATD